MYHLNHARGHNSYNDTELGHVFGPSGVDIQIILDRFGKKNNMVSGLLFFLGLVRVCTNSWRSRQVDNPAIVIFVYHLNHARGHNFTMIRSWGTYLDHRVLIFK